MSYQNLTPDKIFDYVEKETGYQLSAFASPLPSYINRVYELQTKDRTKLIVKFYRPDRWKKEALLDEHQYMNDCESAEIPVVAPLVLKNGTTLGDADGIMFALFPKRSGRQLEINEDRDWIRLGSLLGRLHLVGEKREAKSRITINPLLSTKSDVDFLCSSVIPAQNKESYRAIAEKIIMTSAPLFENSVPTRIHGDCHRGNILNRLEEGLLLIDFDDMAMGPPVQDLWLLLPDRVKNSAYEIELFVRGYEQFRTFDQKSLKCIEPLRAMRMIYFLAWCSRQVNDFGFSKNFPTWGDSQFWEKETKDLREQYGFIAETL